MIEIKKIETVSVTAYDREKNHTVSSSLCGTVCVDDGEDTVIVSAELLTAWVVASGLASPLASDSLDVERHPLHSTRQAMARAGLPEGLGAAEAIDRLGTERDAAVKRADAEAGKRLDWARTARIWEGTAKDAQDEIDRLRAVLRAPTEVGEPPEGWRVDDDGDMFGPESAYIIEDSERPATLDIVSRGRARVNFAAVAHRVDILRARQAQAALAGIKHGAVMPAPVAEEPRRRCVDATNTGDDEPALEGHQIAWMLGLPEPAAPEWDAEAIEATLARAAAEGKRVRIAYPEDWDDKGSAVGVPKRSGAGNWLIDPWFFRVGQSESMMPGIIAAEIIDGDADTESEAVS